MLSSRVLSPDQAHFDLDLGFKVQSPFKVSLKLSADQPQQLSASNNANISHFSKSLNNRKEIVWFLFIECLLVGASRP